jgi:hypothetical protein
LPHLPFAHGKQRRLGQREKETRAGGNENDDYSRNGRWFHAASMMKWRGKGKKQIFP